MDGRSIFVIISERLNWPKTPVHEIVTENLEMKRVRGKSTSKALTDEQKDRRVKMCQKRFDCVRGDPDFLENVIAGSFVLFTES